MIKLCNGDKYRFLSLSLRMSALAFFGCCHLIFFCRNYFSLPISILGSFDYFFLLLLVFLILFFNHFSNSPHLSYSSLCTNHQESLDSSIWKCAKTGYKMNSKWDGWLNEKNRNDTNWWQLQTIASNYACYKPFYTFLFRKVYNNTRV